MPGPARWAQLFPDPVYEAIFVGCSFCQSPWRLDKLFLQFLLPEAMGKILLEGWEHQAQERTAQELKNYETCAKDRSGELLQKKDHRITEHSELEGTNKDHQSPAWQLPAIR